MDDIEKVKAEISKVIECAAVIAGDIPMVNIIATVINEDEYHGCIACTGTKMVASEEHITRVIATILKSAIVFINDFNDGNKEGTRAVFADALLEALVQTGVEDVETLLGKKTKNSRAKIHPWFKKPPKDDDKYDFKEI